MALLEIIFYPDERLRQCAAEVEDCTHPAMQSLIDDLIATMLHFPGCVGLAAPQAGHLLQIIVLDCTRSRKPVPDNHGLLVLINPVILGWNGIEVAREGCLSLPDYTGNVARALNIQVQYLDQHGQERVLSSNAFEARAIQHEMDHLDGRMFIDRVVSRKSDLFPRKHSNRSS